MFAKFAEFFIKNKKLTLVLVIVSMIIGITSYIVLPKQYNPTIIVPAFQVMVPSYWLSSQEVLDLVVSPLENKIMELEWIDEVYWVSQENFAGVMVKFHVWVKKEDAKIRLNQKLNENLDLKPLWVGNPIIKTIDPDELSQITYAISYTGSDLSEIDTYIYLRQIALLVQDQVKTIPNVTTMEIVGGYKNDIVIELHPEKIETLGTDIMQVVEVLQKNNINFPSGNIKNSEEKIFVSLESKTKEIQNLKKIVVSNISGTPLLLEDIADIRYGPVEANKYSYFSDKNDTKKTVFIWFGKQTGTNAVFVTEDIRKKVKDFQKTLPKNVEITVIQNEWQTAKDATNMLLVNLFQSIIIVFIVLALYLGTRDALNTAVSIPLTLALVFFVALILWDNVNRITLFALILVLWMLVDNSTVVVENISRHLKERIHTGKSKLEAVLKGTQEVWVWVILSTMTRLLAFGAMFAVGGMMGEYMWPIPKYAIIALLISLVIAFSINPWLSYLWAKDVSEKERTAKPKAVSKYDIRNIYLNFMKKFLDKKAVGKRKIFKIVFWLSLFAVILWPIYAGIFKARMLPKSNQDQIYIWVDAPRWTSIEKMNDIGQEINNFFLHNSTKNIPQNLDIVSSISTTLGQPFVWDFANLFRGWLQRVGEHQLSARINLISKQDIKNRITSENYTIQIRPIFTSYMLEKFPDVKLRLLEDPPGPPVMATFMINIKWDAQKEDLADFMQKVEQEVKKIGNKMGIEDIGNFNSTTYKKININIDNTSLVNAGLTSSQVWYTLSTIFNGYPITTHTQKNAKEFQSIIVGVPESFKNDISKLESITFTSPTGKKIPLSSIAKLEYTFVDNEIRTDKREVAGVIYGEMGDNSLVYPVLKLIGIFRSDEFLKNDYKLVSFSPYKIVYEGLTDGKKYIIEWSGEWELTLDTFRDLGMAMWISLLAIYFLLVGQFASFGIAGIIMITFLLWFFGVFPGFSILYLLQNEYFSATSMIWVIALAWIVVWNAIILIDYVDVLKKNGLTIEDALLKAWYTRFAPIILTSLTTVFWAATIIWDPVWSGLAWAIIWWLFVSSILTLIVIPIFYYDSQKKIWDECMEESNMKC